jgi:hypothetical protein
MARTCQTLVESPHKYSELDVYAPKKPDIEADRPKNEGPPSRQVSYTKLGLWAKC